VNATVKDRVPHIIFLYWVIKILATTLGETGADMFSMTFQWGYATTLAVFMVLFLVLLVVKLLLKGYHSLAYWSTFTVSAIAGTALSDFIDRTLGLGYALGSAVLVVLLGIVLALWHKKEGSIHVESITKPSVEAFYWTAFLIANTVGTAAGDFIADNLGLGFQNGAILITALLAVIALLHRFTKISGTLLFWLAFVFTRPFGATCGDFLTKPVAKGGIHLGTVAPSLFFCGALLFAIARETRLEKQRAALFPDV